MPGIGVGIGLGFHSKFSWGEFWDDRNHYFGLPSTGVSLIVGQEVTIYGDTLINLPLGNATRNLHVTYTCDIGTQSGNNLVLNPVAGDIGDHSLTIVIKDGGYTITTQTITLKVIGEAPFGTKNILMIGDSLMVSGCGNYHTQIDSILDSCAFTFIGTKGTTTKHEGIAGYTWGMFANNSGSPTFPSPFFKAGVLDIAAYFTDNSLADPDYVYIMLGVNDTFGQSYYTNYPLTDGEITTILNNAKTLIDGFLAYNASLKIILGVPTLTGIRSTAWNIDYPTYPPPAQDRYIENMHKYQKAFIEEFAGGTYDDRVDCEYSWIGLNRDTGYNDTANGGVHPNTTGYTMLGSTMTLGYNKQLFNDFKPTGLTLTWVDDYCQVDFTDSTGGVASHEIWSSRNGAAYTLVTTLAAGDTSYDDYTWQNASMNYKVRAKSGSWYSEFSSVVNISTPLVIKTNQSALLDVSIGLSIVVGKSITIDWGDTNSNNYSGDTTATHTYGATQNPYYITITGDIEFIKTFGNNANNLYGSIAKWKLPTSMQYFTWNAIGSGMGPSGDISGLAIPSGLIYFNAAQASSGNKLSGDMSSQSFPSTIQRFYFSNQDLTGIPRGSFIAFDAGIGLYLTGNNCSITEVDNLLVAMNTFFATNTPVKNSKFLLDGVGMGIPTVTGLAAKSGIEAKFTAAGFTATITVNS
jgi:lysophospholipase L1-like esterase